MFIELKIPEVGESITEVQIAQWLKAEGDTVQKDEPVAVIDSQKTTFELPAPEGGILSKILRPAGETVVIGEVIGHLESREGGAAAAEIKREERPGPTTKSAPAAASQDRTKKNQEPSPGPNKAISTVEQTDGTQIVKKEPAPLAIEESESTQDPQENRTANEAPATGSMAAKPETEPAMKSAGPRVREETRPRVNAGPDEEIVPMSMLRRTVARRLVEAKQQMAMLTTFNEVDMSPVQALRHEHQEAFEKRHGVKLGLMSFFVKSAVDALKQTPQLNAEVRGNDIVYRNFFDIGVAIATGRGLVVPVLRHAERLSFADVEKALGSFAQHARDGKLKPDELEGSTFTITNGGVFGSLLSTPIINPPQSGILGMHTIQERPVAVRGQVVIRPMMYLALTYDHRIVDGREAVIFLRRVKETIESPARMLLEI